MFDLFSSAVIVGVVLAIIFVGIPGLLFLIAFICYAIKNLYN
jgi:hypothetical protein